MPLCVLGSWTYIKTRIKEFMICLLIMETAMLGVFMALDFVLFYILWEAMLIPMYLLIGVWGGPRKIYASIKFFLYTLAGSVMLLVAIIALYLKNGSFSIPMMMGQDYSSTFQIWVFLAFFLAFAIKVPMFPFHTWLPAAHVEAPTAGSVILASILLKMGTYGFLRFCLPITPLATLTLGPYVLWMSVVAILYGGFTALAQSDMKKLIAYSSVGHMGFVTLGIFFLNKQGLEGAILQMINHGVTTGALFIVVGMIYERLHTRDWTWPPAWASTCRCLPRSWRVRAFLTGVSRHQQLHRRVPGAASAASGPKMPTLLRGALICAVPGVVLAAAYMLRMLQRIAYGGPQPRPLRRRGSGAARDPHPGAPAGVRVLDWVPSTPFTGVPHASVEHLIEQAGGTESKAAVPVADRLRRLAASAGRQTLTSPATGLPDSSPAPAVAPRNGF